MEFLLRTLDGKEIPVQRVHWMSTTDSVLILQSSVKFTDEKTRLLIEDDLASRVGCKVAILDHYLRVVGICDNSR